MTTKSEGAPDVDPEMEELRTRPYYAGFKKMLRAASADIAAEDAANTPPAEPEPAKGALEFFDDLFKFGK